ncbi:MAG: phosphonate ABC transporter, permease protein PhnE [Chloroflexi bacterium]|nr:MAG: phosphonate ABC transporter, permease protein PhnE [Chloroflexota bacterium]
MASYFITRGLPVPRELQRSPWTDWRRLGTVAVSIAVIAIGLRITDIDTSRANPAYAFSILVQLFQFDFSILTPQTEFDTFWDTATGLMIITIFLGIIATAFAIVVAVPLSFLGARNIMTGNPISTAIYGIVRLLFTVIRSIDVLIVVILTAVIFGLGSAAGVFALAFHNVGVMGKLYSEAIEGIDPGPIEAITATGANRFQVIWAAVLPQLVNPFVSFSIYRLDTNVRLAIIIGLVGGGGVGQTLFQYIQLLQYHRAGLIIFMIIVTVAAMDFVSAQVRKRLV